MFALWERVAGGPLLICCCCFNACSISGGRKSAEERCDLVGFIDCPCSPLEFVTRGGDLRPLVGGGGLGGCGEREGSLEGGGGPARVEAAICSSAVLLEDEAVQCL